MVNVCHIISGDLWAGAEVMVYHLLRNLKKFENITLSVILFNEGKLAREIRSLGISVDVVDERKHNHLKMVRVIGKILIQRSIDLIHSHRYKENIFAFLSSKYKKNIRLVSTQHGMPEYIRERRKNRYFLLHKINMFLISKSYIKIVVVSNDMKDVFMSRFGFPGDKITVIRNGTEIPHSSPFIRDEKVFKIGSMGRLFPVKDYPLMVEIAKEINKETDKIIFELAGDGPEKAKILDLIERYRLERKFLLRGFVENVFEFYQGLDIFLNTSIHEGIPMSILEAMSYGIPVIAPNTGGMREMISDEIEGYLVEGRDPKVYANKCLNLYNNKSLRRTMGSLARKKVEKEFSNERMAQEYYQLYSDAAYL